MKKKFFKIEDQRYNLWHIFLSSGDNEDYPGCRLTIAGFGKYITFELPKIISPRKEKHVAKSWNAATIERMGRDWYWEYTERQYGVSYCDHHMSIYYGLTETNLHSEEQHIGFFIPWLESRFVRHTLYTIGGDVFYTQDGKGKWDDMYQARNDVDKITFIFSDYDGEEIEAECFIEEREWKRGTGYFKWLSLFYKPIVRRSLDISFNKETGKRKGSWKGGTVGTSTEIDICEHPQSAFRKYCEEHNMIYKGEKI